MTTKIHAVPMKVILIVLDSVGSGEAPDSAEFGDAGSATLQHIAQAVDGLELPTLQKLGAGNIPALLPHGIPIQGCPAAARPTASFGAMQEVFLWWTLDRLAHNFI